MLKVSAIQILSFDFVKWELLALGLLLLAAVFITHGKGIKHAIGFLVVPLLILIETFLIKVLVFIGMENPEEGIRIAIRYVPTVSFVLVLVYSMLIGFWRGFRKSALLLLHAASAAAVCLTVFFICTRSTAFDAWLLKTVNGIMGGETALQDALQVGKECATVRQVLVEYIPSLFGYGSEISIILQDSGAYLVTLADVAFKVVFGIVCYVLYLILDFILYLLYHIAYSERKYKRNKNRKFADNQIDRSYKPHRVAGGAVGLARGLVVGLVSLSFLGSAFFIAAGGTGDGKLKDRSLGEYDFPYSIYRSIESYGSHGIFKVLNAFKGNDGSPYYLFAADLIFSGSLTDEDTGTSQNILLRKELGAYTGFARETLDLMLEYGGDELDAAITSKDSSRIMDAAIAVMKKPAFQEKFEKQIEGFEAQTYIIDFGLNLVTSVVSHIDDMSFASSISEPNRELLKVLFKPGYFSKAIPDERELAATGSTKRQPYIKLSQILTKQDAVVFYRILTTLLGASFDGTDAILKLTQQLLPHIEKLSILSTAKQDTLDPVFGRLYCLLANTYLRGDGEELYYEELYYRDIVRAKVSWVSEINTLLTVADDGVTLYGAIAESTEEGIKKLDALFDGSNPDNIKRYDRICNVLSDSKLIGQVLATQYMSDMLRKLFTAIDDSLYIPDALIYQNTYGDDGAIASYGELYRLMSGLKQLYTSEIGSLLFEDGEPTADEVLDLIAETTTIVDANGQTLADNIIESSYIRSLISMLMTGMPEFLYVPDSVKETVGGVPVEFIDKAVLRQLFEGFSKQSVREAIAGILDGTATADAVLGNEEVRGLLKLKNGIIDGTVANMLIESLKDNDAVVLPRKLERVDGWVSSQTDGELYKLVTAFESSGLTIGDLTDANPDNNTLSEKLLGMDENAIQTVLVSDILYYTVSQYMLSNELAFSEFDVTVPSSVKRTVPNDSVETLIDRDELIRFFICNRKLKFNEFDSIDDILQCVRGTDTETGKDNLSICYESVIIKNIITDTLKKKMPAGIFVDCAAAYERNGEAYLKHEVRALLDLMSELGDGGFDSFALTDPQILKRYIYNEETLETPSYLIANSLSQKLLENENLVVPQSVMTLGMIRPQELVKLLDAYTVLTGGDDIGGWNFDKLPIPNETQTETVLLSDIMRATLTKSIVDANTGRGDLFVAEPNISVSLRQNGVGRADMIVGEQLVAMFDILRGMSDYTLPSFDTSDDLLNLNDETLSVYLSSDMMRYRIGDILLKTNDGAVSENVRNLQNGQILTKQAFGKEQILEIIQNSRG